MGITGHGKFFSKSKEGQCNTSENTASQIIKIKTDLIGYVPKKIMQKEVSKIFKHVDPGVNSINIFPLAYANSLSNKHNDTR